jgi:hypothetical protein
MTLGGIYTEKWVVFMFYDHPPLGEHIKKIEGWRGSIAKYRGYITIELHPIIFNQ